MLLEEDQVRVVGALNNTGEMHGVIDLVLGLEYLLKAEVVVTLLQGVKSDVLVMPIEDLFGLARISRTGSRVGEHRLVGSAGLVALDSVLRLERHLRRCQAEALFEIRLVIAVSHFYYKSTYMTVSNDFKSDGLEMSLSFRNSSLS